MKDINKIDYFIEWLEIEVQEGYKEKFLQYYTLLIEWNEKINLTTITDFDDVIIKHFVDSLLIYKVFDLTNERIIDIGTGAGFPGIPLKIVNPNLNITLVDSLKKRVNFLDEVIEKLDLTNITAIHGRAEDLGNNVVHREQYDLCVSRAVANLAILSEYCIPLVKNKGAFISYKSSKIEEELEASKKAIGVLGGKIKQLEKINILNTDISRSFIVIEKIKKTPKSYPRKSGKPNKDPIK
ncbi:16S rRNA m(7)G-527 methyltransferase [Natranaerovirga hydrolytica]|uniref:Ribosomal RNA small subunit methyltransferase G n=1 Tax=Natranaerovirga hydrolytica TaxID=680378 RepID=A0A4R1M4N8_9FIRM|nr:16S rRNA (guanine(527)-N(7))-methyltransferase RsmG [Natranaerovirga hydrolytica]TCK86785.1 16S rRNA m(7)G-527 methyltransferase [Natranaerovirga hydrolytica]